MRMMCKFINGIAAVNAISIDKRGIMTDRIVSGIINEEYQEVFDDDDEYGEFDARRYLMFLGYNTYIERFGENDFIVTVRNGDEYHYHYANRHIRIKDKKATVINKDIGEYVKTNDENILIIAGNFNWHNKGLYNIAEGRHIGTVYEGISTIDGYSDRFYVNKRMDSLTEDSSKDDSLCITDNLYFQIDQNGHIVSQIFSERKLGFLDYGDEDLDNYLVCYKQELVEEGKKLKEAVYSLKYNKSSQDQ